MYAYIARQPILNQRRETVAYELLYRDGSGNAAHVTDDDAATKGVLVDALTVFGMRQLTDGLPAYVNFTRNLLMDDFVLKANPKQIIVQVMESVQVDTALEIKLHRLRQAGYIFALKNYTGQERFHDFLNLFQIIRVNFQRTNSLFQREVAQNYGSPETVFIADKVETDKDFDAAMKMGYNLFQGYLFEKPFCLFKQLPPLAETSYGKVLSTLMNISPDTSWESICARLIKDDMMLSYMFLREEKALKFPVGHLVTQIRSSVYRMGPHHIRRWTCLVLMKQNGVKGSEELTRKAYQRGLFMEALAASAKDDMPAHTGNAFLLGVFSLLDKVTGVTLERLLRGMDLPRSMREALLGRGENAYTRLLQYAVIYEMGNERLIPPDIHTRLTDTEVVELYMKCMTETDAALARMEDKPV